MTMQLTKFDLKKELVTDGIDKFINKYIDTIFNDFKKIIIENKQKYLFHDEFEANENKIVYDLIQSIDNLQGIPYSNFDRNLSFPNIEYLRELLIEGEFEKIINVLQKILSCSSLNNKKLNEIFLLEKRYRSNVSYNRIGYIAGDDFEMVQMQILKALLDFINELNIEELKIDYQTNYVKYIIQQAKQDEAKTLDIGNLGLDKIPNEIFGLANLEVLIYSSKWYDYETKEEKESQNKRISNQINRIPEEIAKLKNLKALYLGGDEYHNYVSDLSSLKELNNLEILDLHKNRISGIAFLQNLTSLKYLNLSDNTIQNIEGIDKLKKLTHLNLNKNNISNIRYLKNLTNLTSLNLGYNTISGTGTLENLTNLTSLNIGFTHTKNIRFLERLTGLLSLDISLNSISDFSFIENLTALQSLNLNGTRINDLTVLSKLNNLQSLNLRENKIEDLRNIVKLTNLESLNLHGTMISSLEGIEELTNLESLNLHGTMISSLKGIEELTNLKSLNLGETNIKDLSTIKKLSNLESLDLARIMSDITEIVNLTNLKFLDLSFTGIDNLKGLTNLTNLQSLKLQSTRIKDLTEVIKLTNLKSLDLTSTPIKDLEGLRTLTNLESLTLNYIYNFRIYGLDLTEIVELPNLKFLSLRNATINDLAGLSKLTNLQSLDLSESTIKDLSPLRKRIEYGLDIGHDILIDINYIEKPPKSEIESGREAVIRYFEALDKENEVHLNTLKIILAGNSTVGKTSLVEWLKTGKKAKSDTLDKKSTHWLDIIIWEYNRKVPNIDKLNIRFFDFGGQAYYHDAHHIFYSSNTIYFLLWNQELNHFDGKDNYPIEYWLEAIQYFSSDIAPVKEERLKSPILVIQNKIENLINKGKGVAMLNNYNLKKDYPNIYDFAATSLTGGNRGGYLRDIIQEIIEKMDIVHETLPKSRLQWMEYIRKIKKQKRSVLTIKELHRILKLEYPVIEIGDVHATCLRLFSIGDIILLEPKKLNIKKEEKIVFLDIDWVINSIKKVTEQKKADFTQDDFRQLIKIPNDKENDKFVEPTNEGIDALVNLMVSFKMIIKLPEEEFKKPYIFPHYLNSEPNRGMHLMIDNFKKKYVQLKFNGYIHKSVILDVFSTFKDRILTDKDNTNKDHHYFWKNGLILKNPIDDTLVLIKVVDSIFENNKDNSEKGYNSLEILLLRYEQGNRFVKDVRETVRLICKDWRFTELVSPDGESFVPIKVDKSSNPCSMKIGESEFKIKSPNKNLKELDKWFPNNGFIDEQNKIQFDENSVPLSIITYKNNSYKLRNFQEFINFEQLPLRIFISYARVNDEYATELITHLTPFKRNGMIEPWLDRKIYAGDEWKKEIIESINEAETFLFLISPEFLASDFIMTKELKWCFDAKKKNDKIKIIPIILKPCLWKNTLGKYQAVLQGEAIELFKNRDEQWVNILNQIDDLYRSEFRV